ncbi:MAG: efflux RND transporter periplasmic adaptor subunit, partial [Acidobacteriota bacterium]
EDVEHLKRVKVATVEVTTESRELRFSGVTRAARRARLSFLIGGRVVARPVEIGDRVRPGQLLARLDDLELVNGVASAEASVAELSARRSQSERDHRRAEQLVTAKAATSEELERTAAAVDALQAAETAAQARHQEAKRRLAETRLEADFAGTVTEVHFEPGEFARAGSPVVTVSGDGEIEVEVEVPESVIPRIAVGDAVDLSLPVLGQQKVGGRIKSVGRTAAGPGRLFPVVTRVESADGTEVRQVVVGATAELVLKLTSDHALTLPVEAVVNPGGRRPSVFRIAGAGQSPDTVRVEKLEVEVGTLLGDRVIVEGELVAGDQVVVGGQRGLLEGESVMIEGQVGRQR